MGYQSTTDDLLSLDRRLTMFPPPLLILNHQPLFMRLMSDLVSNSNTKRVHAEELLLYLTKKAPALLCHKTSLFLCSPRSKMRFVSAILLRQFFTPSSDFYVWPRISPLCQLYVRVILLLALEEEKIRYIANAKSDTIAELASNLVPLQPQYPELLRFVLVQMAKIESPVLVEASLRIFVRIAKPLADMLVPRVPTLRSILSMCINHPTSSDVRVAALSALCSLLQSLPSSADRKALQSLLTLLHNGVVKALTEIETSDLHRVLEMLIDLAGADPKFFRNFLKNTNIVLNVLAVAENSQVEEGPRHLALEFVTTLAEARNPATAALCKMKLYGTKVLSILLEMLLDVHDDMPWLSAQLEGKETNQPANYALALECLDRLVFALGGNTVLKSAEDMLPAYMIDSDCKKQHAALIALAQILQGCSTEIDLEGLFHDKVLTALVEAIGDFENPCIQVSAAKALTSFIEKCNNDISIHLDKIVRKLVLLLKKGKKVVQEGAVSALTAVAEASSFCKYYDTVMPPLERILTNATNKAHRMLLAKSADCATLIGYVSGRDKFRMHAQMVMGVLISLQNTLNPDDPVTCYVFQATKTVCDLLGHEFLPYMDTLLKPLLECAQLKCDYGVASPESTFDVHSFDMGTEIARVKGKMISLRTSILEEKAFACNVLLAYVESLEEHFFPWAEKVALVCAPLIDFNYHVELKKVSAKVMYQLLKSAKMAIEKKKSQDSYAVKRMFTFMLPKFLGGLHKEQDLETCVIILESLNQCLELSARCLTECQIRDIVEEIKYLITSSDARMRKRENIKTEEYHGEEELIHNESLYEDSIIENIGECLTILIETYKAAFLPFFDELSMYIIPMMVSEESIRKRMISVNCFVDIAEQCGDAAVRYYDACLPSLLVACNDSDQIIRQSGVYGVAICAKFGHSEFGPYVSEALAKINNVIESSDARVPDNPLAYQNAVLALGWICNFHKFRTRAKAMVTWLNCLPIREDHGEAKVIHELFCSMVASSDRQLFGENNKNLIKIISVFTEILSSKENLVYEQTRKQIITILKKLKSQLSNSTKKMDSRLRPP